MAMLLLKQRRTDALIIRFVELGLYHAIRTARSDIPFEPFRNAFKIRYRAMARFTNCRRLRAPCAAGHFARQVDANMNIAKRRASAGWAVSRPSLGRNVDLRWFNICRLICDSRVLRVLDPASSISISKRWGIRITLHFFCSK